MKVLALLGSPRPQGNTATLMNSVLEGLSQFENTTITSYTLNDLEIKPCTACDACLGKTDNFCVIDDDMEPLYPAFIEADLVVLASPIYWWSVSAQLKLFIDRLYGLNHEKNPQYFRDKKIILVFTYEDEDALVALASFLAVSINHYQVLAENDTEQTQTNINPASSKGPSSVIRHYTANDSIFIDEEYLIKGVAGAILWKLLQIYTQQQRTEFTNRELRLDTGIGLPEIGDNLEARLILLQKRLQERCNFIIINKTGRGRFQLQINRGISLQEA